MWHEIEIKARKVGHGWTPGGHTVGAKALILAPDWRNDEVPHGPMSGAHLGFNSWEALSACATRLGKLGYRTRAYIDTQARYALMVGRLLRDGIVVWDE